MILMYHHIMPPAMVPSNKPPLEGWDFTHSPTAFERHLTTLQRRGYRFVSLADLTQYIQRHGTEPAKTVTVTFDDGWLDKFTYALPILKQLAIPATFFCTTSHLQTGKDDPAKMTRTQLQDLLAAGMTIGGHTRTHPNLTTLSVEQATDEIAGCKYDLEQALNIKVKFFAYPGGAFNRSVARLTQDAGYTAACSVLGPAPNDSTSMFWLYRDVLSESMTTWRDRYRLCPIARRWLAFRTTRRLELLLETTAGCSPRL